MNCIKFKLFYLSLLIPNIIDFICTYVDYKDNKDNLDYESNLKSYYIIRFIYQGLYIFYCFSFMSIMTYFGQRDYLTLIIFLLNLILILIFEIISLVLYIKEKNNITFYGKIGYYIHFLNIAETFIICYKINGT